MASHYTMTSCHRKCQDAGFVGPAGELSASVYGVPDVHGMSSCGPPPARASGKHWAGLQLGQCTPRWPGGAPITPESPPSALTTLATVPPRSPLSCLSTVHVPLVAEE